MPTTWKRTGYPTKKEAIEQGKNKYWSSKKCPEGHPGWKFVRNGECCECKAISQQNIRLGEYSGDARYRAEKLRDEREIERLERSALFDDYKI